MVRLQKFYHLTVNQQNYFILPYTDNHSFHFRRFYISYFKLRTATLKRFNMHNAWITLTQSWLDRPRKKFSQYDIRIRYALFFLIGELLPTPRL
jgi:hypothetical protein